MSKIPNSMPKKKSAPKKNPRHQRYAGALVMRIWDDEQDEDPDDVECEVYVSFGEYDEKKNCDSFGVNDDKIFFYCKDEEELKTLAKPNNGNDWFFTSYDLVENDGWIR